jgi:hypothetical protein
MYTHVSKCKNDKIKGKKEVWILLAMQEGRAHIPW